jgi:type IV secretory pathway VirB10-like protein
MNAEDYMSPDASPREFRARTGVRRVNNLPVYMIGGVMSVFLLVMALVAADRAERQRRPAEIKEEKAADAGVLASEIIGSQTSGIIPAETPVSAPVPPDSESDAPLIAPAGNPDAPPLPPKSANLARPVDEEQERIRMAKLQRLEEAVKARTGVQVAAPRITGSSLGGLSGDAPATPEETRARLAAVRQQIDAQTRDDPAAAYQARLRQLQESGAISGNGDAFAPPRLLAASDGPDAGNGQEDRRRRDSVPRAPRTPYELRAGFVVPATLISGVNSDLPGQIMAQVSQDVYDTPTGKWKLIPQGSRLIGRYSSDVAYGQARILVAWQRIVFPDGKAMDIGSMPGADGAGYAGFTDRVNNHYFRLFASAFLMSGVTAGITLSQNQDGRSGDDRRQDASGALSEALGQQLGLVTSQLISKNMNVAPTLEIRPGYRFNVIVTKDMAFSKPYQAFDY